MGEALKAFVFVRYEDGHAAAAPVLERFHVRGFPTLLVLGPDGTEWDEVWGHEPKDLVEDLARVRSGEGTLPALRARVKEHPEDHEAATDLAFKLSDRYADEAIALCERALAGLPNDDEKTRPQLLFARAYAESNRGGNEAALELFDRIVDEYPATDHATRAIVFATNVLPEVEPERGLAFLRKVMPLVDEEMRRDLGHTRGYLYREAAKAEWLRRGEEAGDEPEFLNAYAWECFLAGWHTEEAIRWARKAVELSGRAPHILDTLANLLFRSGDLDEAIRLEAEAVSKEEDPSMRATYEELLVQWKALKLWREGRERRGAEDE